MLTIWLIEVNQTSISPKLFAISTYCHTNGPWWSIMVLFRKWVNRVLINEYSLHTVVWLTDRRSVRGSKLILYFWVMSMDSFNHIWQMCSTGHGAVYGLLINCRLYLHILEGRFLVFFIYTWCAIISPMGTFSLE